MEDVKNGSTYREVLEGLLARSRDAKRRAQLESRLAVPDRPPELEYIWRAFWRLSRRRHFDAMGGPLRLDWAGIDAFLRLTGTRLSPWEIELIEDLDDLYLSPPKDDEDEEGDGC